MALKDWSTTAASNDAVTDATYGDINWSDNQAPNTVNNSARSEMAHVRQFYETIEWRDFGHTPTRTGNTTFTVSTSSDETDVYTVGRRIQCADATTLYGTITASSYSAPTTTVTVSLDSGNLSASLSAVSLGFDPTNVPYSTNTLSGDGVLAHHNNLKIVNGTTAANQITLTADELICTNGTSFIKISDITITDADITTNASGGGTSGYANGFTRGNSEWAYMWVVSDGTNHYLLFDEVVASPSTAGPDMIGFTGYYWAFVGAIYNDSGGAFIEIYQHNNEVSREFATAVASVSSTAVASVNISAIVPPFVTNAIKVNASNFSSSASTFVCLPTNDTGKSLLHGYSILGSPAGSAWVMLNTTSTPTIYYYINTGTCAFNISGWRF